MFTTLFLTLFSASTLASTLQQGLFGSRDEPLLKLPYATYRGKYDERFDTVTFKNIRFAAPPLGELRWAKPAPPRQETEVQNGTVGNACLATIPQMRLQPGGVPPRMLAGPQSEDCLFLDVTVPAKVLEKKGEELPVVVWIYGGAYVVGSKEQGDNPKHMIKAAKGNLIWVAGNYRLSSWGFLNGPTVEKEGTPNVGFHDQRAVFDWVQKHIHLLGGTPKDVTAMGISAGGGSIVHHMIAEGGKLDPLFTRAIIQSPGFENVQDRAGFVEDRFKQLEKELGCTGKGLKCMRAVDGDALKAATEKVSASVPAGRYAYLPTPDKRYIVNNPSVEFATGRFWKGMTKIINSHVKNEGAQFVSREVKDEASFDAYVSGMLGRLKELDSYAKKSISMYQPTGPNDTLITRAARFVTEASFTCHSRGVTNSYPGKVYNVVYEVPPSTHGSDQNGTFNAAPDLTGYQSMLVSFARTGDPNTFRNKEKTIEWPLSTGYENDTPSNVLLVKALGTAHDMELGTDPLQSKERCGFWAEGRQAIQKIIDA